MFPISSVRNRRRKLGNLSAKRLLWLRGSVVSYFGNGFRPGYMEVSSMFPLTVPAPNGLERMSLTAVSRCLQCHAVVNVHWPACLVCKALLPMVSADPPPVSEQEEDSQLIEARPHSPAQAWLAGGLSATRPANFGAAQTSESMEPEGMLGGTGQAGGLVLTDGEHLPLSSIRAVGQTSEDGRLLAAWTVRECGLNGTNTKT